MICWRRPGSTARRYVFFLPLTVHNTLSTYQRQTTASVAGQLLVRLMLALTLYLMYCIYICFILFYIMYNIHIVKRFRAHCGFYAIENKLLLNYYYVPATVTDYVGYQDTFRLNPYLLWLTVLAIMPKRQTGMLLLRMLITSWPLS